jgi:hypothetical protein
VPIAGEKNKARIANTMHTIVNTGISLKQGSFLASTTDVVIWRLLSTISQWKPFP